MQGRKNVQQFKLRYSYDKICLISSKLTFDYL